MFFILEFIVSTVETKTLFASLIPAKSHGDIRKMVLSYRRKGNKHHSFGLIKRKYIKRHPMAYILIYSVSILAKLHWKVTIENLPHFLLFSKLFLLFLYNQIHYGKQSIVMNLLTGYKLYFAFWLPLNLVSQLSDTFQSQFFLIILFTFVFNKVN